MITVLYVDADPKMYPILSKIFEEYSVSVFPADSGEDALAWLTRQSADVIVSDYNLTGMSGIQFHHALRSKGIFLPFIFFSESDNPYVKNKVCWEDIFGFIPRKGLEKKPVLNLLRMVYWASSSHETEYPCIENLKHGN
jgi:CheY-like chemotaxis protein